MELKCMSDLKTVNKVLILVPTLSFGGAEKVAVNLANSYAAQGIEVSLGVFRLGGGYENLLDDKVNLIYLNIKRTMFGFGPVFKLINQKNPDVIISVIVEVNILVGLLSPFLSTTKTLYRQANTMDLINDMAFFPRNIYKTLMRFTYKKSDKVIANSYDTGMDLVRNNIVAQEKIEVIGNPVLPVNVYQLGEEHTNHPWLLDPNLKVLLSVGRLTYQKQHDLLIDTINILKRTNSNIRLIILGQGELYKELQTQISLLLLEDYVEIVEPVDNPYPFYKNADLFVLASRYEGFGNVLVEAMAFGLNIVCNNCLGGPKTLLKDGSLGMLVDNSTPELFAQAINSQLNTGLVSYESLVENSKQYSTDAIADKYLKVLTF
jgi:glycosyltransferase involved in cell wall biosynthesis